MDDDFVSMDRESESSGEEGTGAHKVLAVAHGIFCVKAHPIRFLSAYSDTNSCDDSKSIWVG